MIFLAGARHLIGVGYSDVRKSQEGTNGRGHGLDKEYAAAGNLGPTYTATGIRIKSGILTLWRYSRVQLGQGGR
jgi:hypothetical protein